MGYVVRSGFMNRYIPKDEGCDPICAALAALEQHCDHEMGRPLDRVVRVYRAEREYGGFAVGKKPVLESDVSNLVMQSSSKWILVSVLSDEDRDRMDSLEKRTTELMKLYEEKEACGILRRFFKWIW